MPALTPGDRHHTAPAQSSAEGGTKSEKRKAKIPTNLPSVPYLSWYLSWKRRISSRIDSLSCRTCRDAIDQISPTKNKRET